MLALMIINNYQENNSATAQVNPRSQERSVRGSVSNTPLNRKKLLELTCNPLPVDVLAEVNNCNTERVTSELHQEILSKVDIGIDYLMGNIRLTRTEFSRFLAYVCSSFKIELDFREESITHGRYRFTHQAVSPINGLKLFYKLLPTGKVLVAFICPGKSLRPLSFYDVVCFITRLVSAYNAKFTRIDIRLDDYVRRVSIKYLEHLAESGDVAGVSKYKGINSGAIGDEGDSNSRSLYLGSKRRILNIYNAEFMHGIPADRWEGRFREDRASNIANYIADNIDDFVDDPTEMLVHLLQYCGNKVLDIAKFIDRKGNKSQAISKFKRYDFYQSLLDDVGELDPALLKDEPKPKLNAYQFVTQTFDWLNRQVFKRLAMMESCFGSALFDTIYNRCLSNALDNFNKVDMIRENDTREFIDLAKQHNLPNLLAQIC